LVKSGSAKAHLVKKVLQTKAKHPAISEPVGAYIRPHQFRGAISSFAIECALYMMSGAHKLPEWLSNCRSGCCVGASDGQQNRGQNLDVGARPPYRSAAPARWTEIWTPGPAA